MTNRQTQLTNEGHYITSLTEVISLNKVTQRGLKAPQVDVNMTDLVTE